MAMKFSGGVA